MAPPQEAFAHPRRRTRLRSDATVLGPTKALAALRAYIIPYQQAPDGDDGDDRDDRVDAKYRDAIALIGLLTDPGELASSVLWAWTCLEGERVALRGALNELAAFDARVCRNSNPSMVWTGYDELYARAMEAQSNVDKSLDDVYRLGTSISDLYNRANDDFAQKFGKNFEPDHSAIDDFTDLCHRPPDGNDPNLSRMSIVKRLHGITQSPTLLRAIGALTSHRQVVQVRATGSSWSKLRGMVDVDGCRDDECVPSCRC